MAWECGECGQVEGKDNVKIDQVCHHCGKPLCPRDRQQIMDPAFFDTGRREACHCRDCRKTFHPRSAVLST